MAMEVVKQAYENAKRNFSGFIIGVKKLDGEIGYTFHSSEGVDSLSLQGIKRIMTHDMYKGKGIPEILFVGKVKMKETEKGLEPTIEEVDMSKIYLQKDLTLKRRTSNQ
jgi:hypothetical protein